MTIEYVISKIEDANTLADLRVRAMRPSLEDIGRFDPVVAKARFLDKFDPDVCIKIYSNGALVGFYVLHKREDHFYLDHLYVVV